MPLDLIETQTVVDDGSLYLNGAAQIASVSVGGVTYVVAAAGAESGLTVFSLSKAGILTAVSSHSGAWTGIDNLAFVQAGGSTWLVAKLAGTETFATFGLSAAGVLSDTGESLTSSAFDHTATLSTAKIGTTTFLLTANWNGGLAVMSVGADGSLSLTDAESSVWPGGWPFSLQTFKVGDQTFVMGVALAETSLKVFSLDSAGHLAAAGAATDTGRGGWDAAGAVTLNGLGFVYAATTDDIVVYSVGSDGALTEIGSVAKASGAPTSQVTPGVIDGVTYLFVAGTTGLQVYALGADGMPTLADTVADTGSNALAWSWMGRVISVEGVEMFVTASPSESGVTVLTGNPITNIGSGGGWYQGTDNGDIINGGDGVDSVLGGAGNDVISTGNGSDTLSGEDGDDRLSGGGHQDFLYGGAGADQLDGGWDTDFLFGEDGDDVLNGGADNDLMYGGPGDDTYIVDAAGDFITESFGAGTDTVRSTVDFVLPIYVENLVLLGAGVGLQGFGNVFANVITGTSGDNVLWGRLGADTLNGGAGDDVLWGEEDNDTLYGGAGNDSLQGGDGDDTLYGDIGNDLMYGGAGSNDLYGGKGNDYYYLTGTADRVHEDAGAGTDTIVLRTGAFRVMDDNVENLTVDTGAAADIRGNALNNTILGDLGDDTFYGYDGADTLDGGAGADWLYGHAGADILLGGNGADLLVGGAGADRMTGGTGGDTFAFGDDAVVLTSLGGVAAKDIVYDLNFTDGDVIDLSGIDANINTAGDDEFVWVSKFTRVAGQATIKYTASNNTTVVLLDVDGDGKPDLQINIAGDHSGTTGNWGGDGNGGWIL